MSADVPAPKKPPTAFARVRGFFARQYDDSPTRPQTVFDVLFGGLLPPVLIVLDRAWDPMGEGGILRGTAYALPMSVAAAGLLLAWFALGIRAHWSQAIFAGAFVAAALVSFGVGFLMLPLTMIGMFVLIGFLGYVPFLTAFSLARCAIRALRRAQPDIARGPALGMAFLAALVALGGTAAQGRFAKGVAWHHQQILLGNRDGDERRSEAILAKLYWFPGVPLLALERDWPDAEADRLPRIEDAYYRITGRYLRTVYD